MARQKLTDEERKLRRKIAVKKYKAKAKSIEYIENNFEKHILLRTRLRAAKSGIDFNLDITDIVIPEVCPYTNIKLEPLSGKGRRDSSPSIDRIDPTKGYIKGNIEIISDKANRMKNNASKEELLFFSNYILKRYG